MWIKTPEQKWTPSRLVNLSNVVDIIAISGDSDGSYVVEAWSAAGRHRIAKLDSKAEADALVARLFAGLRSGRKFADLSNARTLTELAADVAAQEEPS